MGSQLLIFPVMRTLADQVKIKVRENRKERVRVPELLLAAVIPLDRQAIGKQLLAPNLAIKKSYRCRFSM